MFNNPANILGFIVGVFFEPLFVWALIVLWIMYASQKSKGLLIGAIVCSAIAAITQLVTIINKLMTL